MNHEMTKTLPPETRHQFGPLELLTDEELAIIGMLAGYAPLFRENAREPLHALGALAGLEENRRTKTREPVKLWLRVYPPDTSTDSPHGIVDEGWQNDTPQCPDGSRWELCRMAAEVSGSCACGSLRYADNVLTYQNDDTWTGR